jgi:hypothetical protein
MAILRLILVTNFYSPTKIVNKILIVVLNKLRVTLVTNDKEF